MPSIRARLSGLCQKCETYRLDEHGVCWVCESMARPKPTAEQLAERRWTEWERMAMFHVKHPALAAAALRVPELGYRCEALTYDETIEDDD